MSDNQVFESDGDSDGELPTPWRPQARQEAFAVTPTYSEPDQCTGRRTSDSTVVSLVTRGTSTHSPASTSSQCRGQSPTAVRRLPRLKALFGKDSLSSPSSVPNSQEHAVSVTPSTGAPSLAELLFPPSPLSSQEAEHRGENEQSRMFSKEGGSAGNPGSDSNSSNVAISTTKEPSSMSRKCSSPFSDKSREEMRKTKPFTVYTLDDSSDEEDDGLLPSIMNLRRLQIGEIPKKARRLPLAQTPSGRKVRSARRQVASTSPVNVRRSEISTPSQGSVRAETEKSSVEVLVIDDSDSNTSCSEELGRSVELEVEEPESEFDPDAGVISFIPTKSSSRPQKLSMTLMSTPAPKSSAKRSIKENLSPSAARGPAEVDLTTTLCSSDEDEEGEEDDEHDDLPAPFRAKIQLHQSLTPSTPRSSKSTDKTTTPTSRKATANLLTAEQRDRLPFELIAELNQSVFCCYYSSATSIRPSSEPASSSSASYRGLPADIDIIWSKKLLKTAGRASWKRTKPLTSKKDRAERTSQPVEQTSSIELSVKVVDSVAKLNNTLAHELCHLAAWVISGELNPPHGKAFKLWAARVMAARHDIEVTTTHSYQILYKYRWRCQSLDCQKIFQRHSRSIDTTTHGCPCGSRLMEIDKDGRERGSSGVRRTPAKKTAWQTYLATMSPQVRQESPGIKQDQVFKRVAEMWKEEKENVAAALEKSMKQLEIS
ncbi:BQ2448_4134 [Microbotryum intermedium]|uniref:BQ2448_4134 protein n=1 Tax=Microbotryum intermedium TaxID=269621 RepID=A0A238FH86_9BASI|nr:BQ2448_4134 [Microbotryum intermedium]